MKLKSLFVLIVLIVSIVTPFKLQISTSQNSKVTFIFTLNVCHASDASLSVNTESPSLCECPCKLPMPQFDGFNVISEPPMVPFLIPFKKERPPKV
jgi:hypothetical protein